MKKFLKIMLIIIGAISLIFVALIGIGLFVDVEYDDHIENGRYTYVPEEENKDNEYVEFTINDYDKNNAKLVYYDTIEEAIQLSTLNAENEELSVPADFLNHVDETLHIWQGKKYDTIFYRAGNDNDDIQGLVMARCKKQIQNGHTQYAFINATPVTTKRDRILLDDKEIYSLEVEGQKPDGVIEINVYDRVMYLWYYNDLQSNKRGDCLSYSVDVPK